MIVARIHHIKVSWHITVTYLHQFVFRIPHILLFLIRIVVVRVLVVVQQFISWTRQYSSSTDHFEFSRPILPNVDDGWWWWWGWWWRWWWWCWWAKWIINASTDLLGDYAVALMSQVEMVMQARVRAQWLILMLMGSWAFKLGDEFGWWSYGDPMEINTSVIRQKWFYFDIIIVAAVYNNSNLKIHLQKERERSIYILRCYK